jgi:hypothetical protein
LALTPRAGGTPGRLAAAAQDRLAGEPDGGTDAGGAATPGSSGGGGSKRKRSGSRRAAAAATDGEAAAMAGGGGGGAAAAAAARQGPGKGLRHFSLKVCEKVESKGDTSYEEVANELIADLAAEVAAGGRAACLQRRQRARPPPPPSLMRPLPAVRRPLHARS